jgi:hypothetical protein
VKYLFSIILCILCCQLLSAQKLDSIFFNLYTDSLKKGTYNYINVDGRFSDSSYLPLSEKEIRFTASAGKFTGNSLYIDTSFPGEKILIKAVLIKNPRIWQQREIYIKRSDDNERLPTVDEIMGRPSRKGRRR